MLCQCNYALTCVQYDLSGPGSPKATRLINTLALHTPYSATLLFIYPAMTSPGHYL